MAATASVPPCLLEILPEPRSQIYEYLLESEPAVRVKPLRRYLKPNVKALMQGIWLASPSALAGTCRQAYRELHGAALKHGISGDTAFVVEVHDFDFRNVTKVIDWMKSDKDRSASLINADPPKVVAELHLTNARSIKAERLGSWSAYCKDSDVSVSYSLSIIDKPDEVLKEVIQLSGVMLETGKEMEQLVEVVAEYVSSMKRVARRVAVMSMRLDRGRAEQGRSAGVSAGTAALVGGNGGASAGEEVDDEMSAADMEDEGDVEEGTGDDDGEDDLDSEDMSSEEDFTDEELSDA